MPMLPFCSFSSCLLSVFYGSNMIPSLGPRSIIAAILATSLTYLVKPVSQGCPVLGGLCQPLQDLSAAGPALFGSQGAGCLPAYGGTDLCSGDVEPLSVASSSCQQHTSYLSVCKRSPGVPLSWPVTDTKCCLTVLLGCY